MSKKKILSAISALIDAAEARADACSCEWRKAEARADAASELLERCLDEIDCDIYDDLGTQQLVFDGRKFLSSNAQKRAS